MSSKFRIGQDVVIMRPIKRTSVEDWPIGTVALVVRMEEKTLYLAIGDSPNIYAASEDALKPASRLARLYIFEVGQHSTALLDLAALTIYLAGGYDDSSDIGLSRALRKAHIVGKSLQRVYDTYIGWVDHYNLDEDTGKPKAPFSYKGYNDKFEEAVQYVREFNSIYIEETYATKH